MKKGPIIAAIVALVALGIFIKIESNKPPEDVASAMVPNDGDGAAGGADNGGTTDATTEPAGDPLPEGDPVSYEVSVDDSNVEFTGYKVGGEQNCTFFEFEGSLAAIANDPRTLVVDMSVDLESIIHDNQTFVIVMLGEAFFDVKNHPTGTFKSSKVEKDGEGWKVTGDLTLRGKAVTIAFPADIELSDDGASLDATFRVDRLAWGMNWEGKKDALIKDEVDMSISLVAEKSDG